MRCDSRTSLQLPQMLHAIVTMKAILSCSQSSIIINLQSKSKNVWNKLTKLDWKILEQDQTLWALEQDQNKCLVVSESKLHSTHKSLDNTCLCFKFCLVGRISRHAFHTKWQTLWGTNIFHICFQNLLKLLSSKLEPEEEAVDNSKATLYALLTLSRPFGDSAYINLSASSCKLKEMLLIVSTSKGKKI